MARISQITKVRIIDIVAAFIIMGSMWQKEIALLNIMHGWPFGYLFSLIIIENNWAAMDFFTLLILVGAALLAWNGSNAAKLHFN